MVRTEVASVKRVLFLLALAFPAFAQTQTNLVPDCVIGFTFSAVGQFSTINPASCGHNIQRVWDWRMSYDANGFSPIQVELQSAPDSSGSPGTWAAFTGTVVDGANPSTSTTNASLRMTGYQPWVRVILLSATGTGTVTGTLYGCRAPGCSQGTAGGGGGGSCSMLAGDVTGTCAANTVVRFRNRAVAATSPSDGDVYGWVNTDMMWEPGGIDTGHISDFKSTIVAGVQTVQGGRACITGFLDCTRFPLAASFQNFIYPVVSTDLVDTVQIADTSLVQPGQALAFGGVSVTGCTALNGVVLVASNVVDATHLQLSIDFMGTPVDLSACGGYVANSSSAGYSPGSNIYIYADQSLGMIRGADSNGQAGLIVSATGAGVYVAFTGSPIDDSQSVLVALGKTDGVSGLFVLDPDVTDQRFFISNQCPTADVGILITQNAAECHIFVNQGFSPTWTGTHTFTQPTMFTTLSASLPVFSDTSKNLVSGTAHGNSATVQMSDGTGTSQHLAAFDAAGNITDSAGTGVPFASLGAPGNGADAYCNDCNVTSAIDNTCASGGAGAKAFRINAAWKCSQ